MSSSLFRARLRQWWPTIKQAALIAAARVRNVDSASGPGILRPVKSVLDIPPIWLGLAIIIAWMQARALPLGLSLRHPAVDLLSGLLIGAGIVLFALAAIEFRRARTTIIPHQDPSRLITTGIFSRTRNPIYLADALILGGLILRFDAVVSLILVPIFVWWIERHFIVAEEDRMRRLFRAEFARYEQKVRRWL
ncbi:MAG: isoprenylcysteine carboxylmethyltransferase family protein [Pseudomonadota bacterium]